MWVYPEIDPVAVQLGPLSIHWYGLMYVVSFAAVWALAHRRRATLGLTGEQIQDLIFYAALGVVLGGRFGYALFYHLDRVLADPLWIFKVWEGGMSFHGGLLGVLLALFIFVRRYGIADAQNSGLKHPFWRLSDFIAPLVPLGLGAGRIGNFIGGELWGRPTDLPWGMVFPHVDALARHPSQLYQAALEGLGLFVLLHWYQQHPRPAGAVSGVFLLGYASARFLAEFARQPDAHLGLLMMGLSMGQILTLPMFLAGAWLLHQAYRR